MNKERDKKEIILTWVLTRLSFGFLLGSGLGIIYLYFTDQEIHALSVVFSGVSAIGYSMSRAKLDNLMDKYKENYPDEFHKR